MLNEKQVTAMLRASCQRLKLREDNIETIWEDIRSVEPWRIVLYFQDVPFFLVSLTESLATISPLRDWEACQGDHTKGGVMLNLYQMLWDGSKTPGASHLPALWTQQGIWLAISTADLNLKLMRWRALPSLNLNVVLHQVSSFSCWYTWLPGYLYAHGLGCAENHTIHLYRVSYIQRTHIPIDSLNDDVGLFCFCPSISITSSTHFADQNQKTRLQLCKNRLSIRN
ncbi:hypothetical protein IFM89_038391 [Coptis chinensis]|uniref:Uncharacterized protein n=1 Tax=Coptis chinensis TaxID=261450 RepID=A0A835LGC3_9MAGN|nr:hypothetical protein IFM89_038391 [Coptis chinensis]